MSMLTVDSSLIKGAITQLPVKEYIELLRDATEQEKFLKVLRSEVKLEASDSYVNFKTKIPGLSYYFDYIKGLVFTELANNPELVWILSKGKNKYLNLQEMHFTEYRWYDDDEDTKVNILKDDAVLEHWHLGVQLTGIIDLVKNMDADELGDMCVKIQEYIDDEQIPASRKDIAKVILQKLSYEKREELKFDEAYWLESFGFMELPEVEIEVGK